MKKKKSPLDLIERNNFVNDNSFHELENAAKLEKMFGVLTLLNLNYSSEDENVLKNYLVDVC